MIVDIEKIQKVKVNREDASFVDIKVTAHSNNRNSKSSREVILGSVRL